jgi:SAM-dependent methyltransferase
LSAAPPDIAALAPGLRRGEAGIWFSARQQNVSYPAHGNAACRGLEDGSFWFQHRNQCIVGMIERFRPEGMFLDIGGGNGFVAKGLADAGVRCALIEPGIDGARAARARGIEPVICARFEDVALPPGSIAAAGMFDVLEHIEDDGGVLRRVHALLRPGGWLFLTVPAYRFLFSADDIVAGHFRRYSRNSLARAVTTAGFAIAYSGYMFAPLPPPIFLFRTIPSRLGLRQGRDPERDAAEHAPHGLVARLVARLLAFESLWLRRGRSLPFGSSCLCVAFKMAA